MAERVSVATTSERAFEYDFFARQQHCFSRTTIRLNFRRDPRGKTRKQALRLANQWDLMEAAGTRAYDAKSKAWQPRTMMIRYLDKWKATLIHSAIRRSHRMLAVSFVTSFVRERERRGNAFAEVDGQDSDRDVSCVRARIDRSAWTVVRSRSP